MVPCDSRSKPKAAGRLKSTSWLAPRVATPGNMGMRLATDATEASR